MEFSGKDHLAQHGYAMQQGGAAKMSGIKSLFLPHVIASAWKHELDAYLCVYDSVTVKIL